MNENIASDRKNEVAFCRCCLTSAFTNGTSQNLFDMKSDTFGYKFKSITYYDSYLEVSGCSIEKIFNIPVTDFIMCRKCAVQLENVFNFRKQCCEAMDALEKKYCSPVVETLETSLSNQFQQEEFPDDEFVNVAQELDDYRYNNRITKQLKSVPSVRKQCCEVMDALEKKYCSPVVKTLETPQFHQEMIAVENSDVKFVIVAKELQPKPQKSKTMKDYRCQICEKSFTFRKNLRHHVNIEHFKFPLPCPNCKMKFQSSFHLRRHIQNKHLISNNDELSTPQSLKPKITLIEEYRCQICPKKFIAKKNFQRHINVDHAEHTISCPHCKIKFSEDKYLQQHIQSKHLHVKITFKCDECPLVFKCKSTRSVHKKCKHKNIRYQCKMCDKVYNCGSNLWIHNFSHETEPDKKKPFKCEQCHFETANIGYLKIHLKAQHQIIYDENTYEQHAAIQVHMFEFIKKCEIVLVENGI